MATNNKERVKNVANNVWAALCWCGNALLKLGQIILIGVVLLLLFIFVLNPVMFCFWSIIFPRNAAECLYDLDLPVFGDIMQALDGWMVRFYPLRMKKHFMEVRGIKHYPSKDQCNYYYHVNLSTETIKQMSDEGRYMLFEGTKGDKMEIVKAGFSLSDKQFKVLADTHYGAAINIYISRRTPSSEMVKVLIANGMIDSVVCVCRKYGLSADLVKCVFASKNADMIEAVQEALIVYSQCQIVLTTGDCDWKVFCSKKDERIRVEAQKLMSLKQYEVFHNAGHVLENSAVEAFLAKGDVAMCGRIFRHEKNYGMVSDLAKALVAGNTNLTTAQLRVMAEKSA